MDVIRSLGRSFTVHSDDVGRSAPRWNRATALSNRATYRTVLTSRPMPPLAPVVYGCLQQNPGDQSERCPRWPGCPRAGPHRRAPARSGTDSPLQTCQGCSKGSGGTGTHTAAISKSWQSRALPVRLSKRCLACRQSSTGLEPTLARPSRRWTPRYCPRGSITAQQSNLRATL